MIPIHKTKNKPKTVHQKENQFAFQIKSDNDTNVYFLNTIIYLNNEGVNNASI